MNIAIKELRGIAKRLESLADLIEQDAAKPEKGAAVVVDGADADAERIAAFFAPAGIGIEIASVRKGPVVKRIEFSIPNGCRYAEITDRIDGLQKALGMKPVRIEAPVPGKEAVAVEIPLRDGQ